MLPAWRSSESDNLSGVVGRECPSTISTPAVSHLASAASAPLAITSPFSAFSTNHFEIDIFLVDDGSTDGTAQTVAEEFPDVHIIRSSGDLYWCGGMRAAWTEASTADPDYYLLLNDDTTLQRRALDELMVLVPSPGELTIAVGAISNPAGTKQTYGGVINWSPAPPTGAPLSCETFNANCVLIPQAVFTRMGMFYSGYTHAMGDFDYGIRASRRGIQILQTPDFVGSCQLNSTSGTWRDRSLSRIQRWRLAQSPKGLPWREWLTFCLRNHGARAPMKFISPYLRIGLGL